MRTIDRPVGRWAILPSVMVGIGHVQALLYLCKTDAVTTFVVSRLRMVRVLYLEVYMLLVGFQTYVDKTLVDRTDAVFEGILH